MATDPDRPPIAVTSLYDTPLKVKICDELPAGKAVFGSVIQYSVRAKGCCQADGHKEPAHEVPKLRENHFRK
jgi:hypothetical protein